MHYLVYIRYLCANSLNRRITNHNPKTQSEFNFLRFWWEPIIIYSVLLLFKLNLLAAIQYEIFVKSLFTQSRIFIDV